MLKLKRRKFEIAEAIALLAVGAAAYGRLLWAGGVFGDDANIIFAYQQTGISGVRDFLSWSRPFSTWPYAFTMPLLGANMRAYHITTFLLRMGCAWLFFVLIRKLFPGQRNTAVFAAVLFLIYPGFSQQAHALHYLLHFAVLALVLLSFLFMIQSYAQWNEKGAWVVYIGSILLACAHISVEYFVGLELLRLSFLWLMRRQDKENGYPGIAAFWLSYGCLLLVYAICRIFFFRPVYPPLGIREMFAGGVWGGLAGLVRRAVADLWKTGVLAWGNAFNADLPTSANPPGIIAGVAAGTALLLVIFSRPFSAGEPSRQGLKTILLGLGGMAAGGIPLWASQLPLKNTFPWDRTSLCFIVGACLLMAGLLSLLPRRVSAVLFSVLVVLCIQFQSATALDYTEDWAQLRSIMGQFSAQVPGFKTETLILYDDLPLTYYSANNLNAFFNHIYDLEPADGIDRVKVLQISERLGNLLPALEKGINIEHGDFRGTTDKALVIGVDFNGCVVILDAEIVPESTLPGLTNAARRLSVPEKVVDMMGEHSLPEILEIDDTLLPICRD